jgi:hypothetical protein
METYRKSYYIFDIQWRELVNAGGTWLELLIEKMTTPLICVIIALWQFFQILQLKFFMASHLVNPKPHVKA